jgi:hypothetical protein
MSEIVDSRQSHATRILLALAMIPLIVTIPSLITAVEYPTGLSVEPPESHSEMTTNILLVILDGLPAYVMSDPDFMPNLANWSNHGSTLSVTTGEMTLTGACTKEMSTGRHASPIDAARNWAVKYEGVDDPFHYAERDGKDVAFTGFYVWSNLFPGEEFEHQTVFDHGFSDVYEADNKTLDIVDEWILDGDREIMIAHLGGTDHAGHIWGVRTPEYKEKMNLLDTRLEEIRLAAPNDWAVMFTADHGMNENGGHAISTGEDAMQVSLLATGVPFVIGSESSISQRDISSLFTVLLDLPFPVASDARIPLNVLNLDESEKEEIEIWNWNAAVQRQHWLAENGYNSVEVDIDEINWDIIPQTESKFRIRDIIASTAIIIGIIVLAWMNRDDSFELDNKAITSLAIVGIIWLLNNLLYFGIYDFSIIGYSTVWIRRGVGIIIPTLATLLIFTKAIGDQKHLPSWFSKLTTFLENNTSSWFLFALLAIALWQPDARLSPSLISLFLILMFSKILNESDNIPAKRIFMSISMISLFTVWNHIPSLITGYSIRKLSGIDFLYKFELNLVLTFMTDNFIPASILIIITLWLVWIIERKVHNWTLEGLLLVGVIIIHANGNSWTDRIILLSIIGLLFSTRFDLKTRLLTPVQLAGIIFIIPTWGVWPASIVLLLTKTIPSVFNQNRFLDSTDNETNLGPTVKYLALALIPFMLISIVWSNFGQLTMIGLIELNPSKYIVTGGFFGERIDPPIIWMALMTGLPLLTGVSLVLFSWKKAGHSLSPFAMLIAFMIVTKLSHLWIAFDHPQVFLMVVFSSFIMMMWYLSSEFTSWLYNKTLNERTHK